MKSIRRITAMALLSLLAVTATAIPAKREWRIVTQPDGTRLEVMLVGDENYHYFITRENVALIEQKGVYYYAEVADRQLVPTNIVAQSGSMKEAIAQQKGYATAARAKALRPYYMRKAPKHIGERVHETYTGKKKGLIILVEFPDTRFLDITEGGDSLDVNRRYQALANEKGYSEDAAFGSVHDYFLAQSYGKFDLTFDVVGPVMAKNDHSYYGEDVGNASGNDLKVIELLQEMCSAVDSMVDFTQYDWNQNGEVEEVFLLYAGKGQATGGGSTTIWPHMWSLKEAMDMNFIDSLPQHDGVKINVYACSNELYKDEIRMGIGVICHEFSHCLGLPDVYDTGYGGNAGLGDWDLMASGSYNGPLGIGWNPAAYTAYERNYAGWLDFTELKDSGTFKDIKPVTEEPTAFVMRNDGHADEYYVLEHRTQTGWDKYVPGSGLLIYHVDYNEAEWMKNSVNAVENDDDHERMAIVRASGYSYDFGDAYPYQGNNSFTDNSSPAIKLHNPNTDGTYKLRKGVTDITQESDGTMSFVFVNSSQQTSISDLAQPESGMVEVYDLSARRVKTDPQPSGVSIVRDAQGKVYKRILR